MSTLPPFSQREQRPEIMDRLDLPAARHHRALAGLARLNRWAGSAELLWEPISSEARASDRPLRVLDVACGAGDVAIALARRARHAGLRLEWAGCDRSELAVDHARAAARRSGERVAFSSCDVLAETSLPERYDVVICSLFMHHLDQDEAQRVLALMAAASRRLLLVADLRRARAGYLLAWSASRLLTRSNIVHRDAPTSVRAAFRRDELAALAALAGLAGAEVRHAFPQRLLLSWRPT